MSAAVAEPRIVALNGRSGSARCDDPVHMELRIPVDLSYFEGHFPGCPLLPGVVQVHWALRYGRQYFELPPRVTHLANIKFMRIIAPGSPAELRLEVQKGRSELRFEYRVGEHVCSSGVIGLAT